MDERQAGTPSDAEIDRLLQETELMLRHTRAFLDHLAESERLSREYLREMEQLLERRIEHLESRKNRAVSGQAS